jgi:hypothetical protein
LPDIKIGHRRAADRARSHFGHLQGSTGRGREGLAQCADLPTREREESGKSLGSASSPEGAGRNNRVVIEHSKKLPPVNT